MYWRVLHEDYGYGLIFDFGVLVDSHKDVKQPPNTQHPKPYSPSRLSSSGQGALERRPPNLQNS